MSNPPRYPLPSTSNRPSPSYIPRDEDDLTWLDFLRTAGHTVPPPPPPPSNREHSADRKRRHPGSSPERRSYPNPPSYNASMSGAAERAQSGTGAVPQPQGSSVNTAIDLTSPPRPRPTVITRTSGQGSAGSGGSRTGSDVVVPKWQADNEVIRCPVCKIEFSFWYRKHHCRKCGRVVCAACSPHRITIPRQYIVQPPAPFETEFVANEPESPRPMGNPALGGGEVVRVCNPCVPDPWTPPRPPTNAQGTQDVPARPLIEQARSAEGRSDLAARSERYRYIPQLPQLPQLSRPPPFPAGGGRTRSSSHQAAVVLSRSMPQGQANPPPPPPFSYGRPAPHPPTQSRPYAHRYTQSSNNTSTPPIPFYGQRPPLSTAPSAPPQPKPRREVKEEDECPICGIELPPGAHLRETHIQECIATRFSSTPSNSTPIPPPPPARRTSTADVASSSTPPAPAARPRATSYRPRGMALYIATEKDCTNEDGETQECVICFEEFQPGDEMGRMECLCKFHRACIRQWWDTKGAGSCPTHQLHD